MNFRTPRRVALLLAMTAVSVSLVAAACGGDDDDDDTADTATTTSTAATTTTGTATQVASPITISDVWARTTTNDVSAAYMMIKNTGVQDRLVSATADVSPKVQIHEVITEGNTSKMQEIPGGLVIPANASVELKPGGYHIMLMDLPTKKLDVGQKVEIDLVFEKAGKIHVTAEVKQGGGMDMGSGSMSGTGTATTGHGMGTATASATTTAMR